MLLPAHGLLASVGNARAPLAAARVRIVRWYEERGRVGRGNDAQTALGLLGGDQGACRRRRSYGGRYCHRHRSGVIVRLVRVAPALGPEACEL